MKYFFYFLFLTFFHGYSQNGVITYESIIISDNSTSEKSKKKLFFNEKASLYRDPIAVSSDKKDGETTENRSTKTIPINENTTSETIRITYTPHDPDGFQYYFDTKTNEFTCRELLFSFAKKEYKPYIYTDSYAGKIEWQLKNEFKNISGYQCQKAVADFRGRIYTAWFTTKIPLPYGPWKLNGLPGLILEVYDETGTIYLVAKKIEIPKDVDNLLKKPTKGTRIIFREFVEKDSNKSDEITKALKARLPKGGKIISTKTENTGKFELEYEWEKG